MRERFTLISNILGLLAVAGIVAAFLWSPSALPEPQLPPPQQVEVSLEAPEEKKPEEPKQEEAQPVAPKTEEKPAAPPSAPPPPAPEEQKPVETPPPPPPPPTPEPPPPEPKPPETPPPPPPPPPPEPPPPEPVPQKPAEPPAPPKTEEPVKPPEPLLDPDGQLAAQAQKEKAVPEKEASAFKTCLQRKARYPSAKVTTKQRPHGTVVVTVTISGGIIGQVEITTSSGSAILDEAAKTSVTTSGCGALAGSGKISGTFVY